jgi:hypothetical protein
MHCAKCFFYETSVGDEVCNRCGRAYLPEANLYLGLLALVTGGAAWTLRNLLTGQADPLARPTLDLGAWVTWPVSIVECPAYGLVLGAWLAVLAVTPILAGIMYGKRGGWFLVIVEALVGPSLGLAAVTALGVWIAAGWTLRLQTKIVSALAGLAPVAAYWFVATALTDLGKGSPAATAVAPLVPRVLAPALHSMVYVPAVTAVVVAVAAGLLAVGMGWVDRWHVRWPAAALAVLAVGPALALVAFVGVDEIRYGLLGQAAAGDLPAGQAGSTGRAGLASVPGEAALASEMNRFQQFLGRCPGSPRAAEVRARLAADIEQIENGSAPGAVPCGSDEVWQELANRHPKSPWAVDARLHLGDAAIRRGAFEQAEPFYRTALAQTAYIAPPAEDPLADFSVVWDLFTIGAELRARQDAEHLRSVRRELLMHLALILENRQGTPNAGRALAMYFVALGLKGTSLYRDRLLAVAEADPKGPLADNVAYDLAMLETDDVRRLEALRQVAAAYPGEDGAMLALMAAARSLVTRAATDPAAMRQARKYLAEVQADLARRGARNLLDPYVAALGDAVEKELVYVQAQLQTPAENH